MAGRQVVLVPGNHDHRLAEPLLEELALGGGQLGLEHHAPPRADAATQIAGWLGEAELSTSPTRGSGCATTSTRPTATTWTAT